MPLDLICHHLVIICFNLWPDIKIPASHCKHCTVPADEHCCCMPRFGQSSAGMAAPVEVGAQGTVGSLVLQEVEYFRRMEVAGGHGKKSSSKVVAAAAAAAGGGSPRSRSNSKKPKNKKKDAVAGNGSFLPRMCSSAEVAEDSGSGRRERPSRVRYRPLGDDGDALPQQD